MKAKIAAAVVAPAVLCVICDLVRERSVLCVWAAAARERRVGVWVCVIYGWLGRVRGRV